MAIIFKDVLKAELALVGLGLLNNSQEFEGFRSRAQTDVVNSGQTITIEALTNVAESGRSFSLNRDRIVLDISPSRASIRRDYPSEQDLGRLAEVASLAIEQSSSGRENLRAFGYNIDLVYDQDSTTPASQYLAERLFSEELPRRGEWNLVGGSGKLTYSEGENQWQITVEPRFNEPNTSRVFLTLNLHKEKQVPPSESEIKESLMEAWAQAHDFAVLLDKKGM